MAGLLDLFGGGNSGALYGDALTPDQQQAINGRGLLGFLGGMAKSGALDYTMPTITGQLPGGFAKGLAGGMAGSAQAQDEAAQTALKGGLLGLQGQQLKSQLMMRDKLMAFLPQLLGGDQAAAGKVADALTGNAPSGTAGDTTPAPNADTVEQPTRPLAAPTMAGSNLGVGGATRGNNGWPIPMTGTNNEFPPLPPNTTDAGPSSGPGWAPGSTPVTPASYNPARQPLGPVPGLLAGNSPAPVTGGLLASPGATGAAPAPPLTNGINPRALAAAGVMAQLGGIGDAFKPLESYYYNSPGYKGTVAQAEAAGKGAGEQPFIGPAARLKSLNTFENLRQGGMLVDPATGRIIAQAPKLPEGTSLEMGPAGQPIAREVPGALNAIRDTHKATTTGTNEANLGPLVNPAQPGQRQPGQQPVGGFPLAKGLTSTVPDYQEPSLTPAELHSRIPEWTKAGREMTSAIGMAQQAEHRLVNIADAFKLTEPGTFATHKADVAAALKGLGIAYPTSWDPASVQLALHENYRATLQNLAAVNKRFSQMEFKITSQNSEHPDLQPEANLNMLSEDIGSLRQMQGMGTDWLTAQNAGKHNPDAFETQWLNANPLNKISDAVKKEIGPLKGMPGGPGSAPPSAAAIRHLQMSPQLRNDFDAKYGEGAAAKVLGQ